LIQCWSIFGWRLFASRSSSPSTGCVSLVWWRTWSWWWRSIGRPGGCRWEQQTSMNMKLTHTDLSVALVLMRLYSTIRVACRLQPVRVCVLGPPAVGKSTVSKQICERYKLHHITLMDAVSEAIAQLVSRHITWRPEIHFHPCGCRCFHC